MSTAAAQARWLRSLAAHLLSTVGPVLPAAATLGTTGFVALLVVRVAALLGRRPTRRS